jgi:hypothetical protein
MGFATRESVQEYMQIPPSKPGYVPQLVLVDRKRVIRGEFIGGDDFFKDQDKNIRAQVETLLKEPVAARKNGRPARKKPS